MRHSVAFSGRLAAVAYLTLSLPACGSSGGDSGMDAGPPASDIGGSDSGSSDMGFADSALPGDTGSPDLGSSDMGLADSALPGDMGSPDLGSSDMGLADSALPSDVGSPDGSVFMVSTPMDFQSDQVPVIDVTALGGPAIGWLYDTGFPYGMADTDIYPSAMPTQIGIDIDAFGMTFLNVDTLLGNLFGPAQPGAVQAIGGIVGAGFIASHASVFDYQNEMLYLIDPLSGDPGVGALVGPAVVLPFTPLGGGGFGTPLGPVSWGAIRVVLQGSVEGMPANFLLDTGASRVVLEESFFNSLGDPGRPMLDVEATGGAGVLIATISRVTDVTIGTASVAGPPVYVIPGLSLFAGWSGETGIPIHGVVGSSFLREFLLTLNFPANEVRLAPYLTSSHINPNEYVGPGFEVQLHVSGEFIVSDVWLNTDAEAQGVVPDMVLAEVNGVPVTSFTRAGLHAFFTTFMVGSSVDFGFRDAGGTITITPILIEDHLPSYP